MLHYSEIKRLLGDLRHLETPQDSVGCGGMNVRNDPSADQVGTGKVIDKILCPSRFSGCNSDNMSSYNVTLVTKTFIYNK